MIELSKSIDATTVSHSLEAARGWVANDSVKVVVIRPAVATSVIVTFTSCRAGDAFERRFDYPGFQLKQAQAHC